MPQIKQFLLPDPAEGLTEAEIVSWKVAVGDTVVINQPIVDIETAKSLVELPCPFAGTVVEIHVAEGVTADVGTPIISIDVDPDGASPAGAPTGGVPEQATAAERPEIGGPGEEMVPKPPDEGFIEPGLIGGAAPGGRTSVLVGYGPKSQEAKRRPRRGSGSERDTERYSRRAGGVLGRPSGRQAGRADAVGGPGDACSVGPRRGGDPAAGRHGRRRARRRRRPRAGQAAGAQARPRPRGRPRLGNPHRPERDGDPRRRDDARRGPPQRCRHRSSPQRPPSQTGRRVSARCAPRSRASAR